MHAAYHPTGCVPVLILFVAFSRSVKKKKNIVAPHFPHFFVQHGAESTCYTWILYIFLYCHVYLKWQGLIYTSIENREWIIDYIHVKWWDVNTHTCFNGRLGKVPFNVRYGWVTTSHIKLDVIPYSCPHLSHPLQKYRPLGVISLTFRALFKIISRKCTIPEITFMVIILSWNFVRVPKAWLWAHVQSFSLKIA